MSTEFISNEFEEDYVGTELTSSYIEEEIRELNINQIETLDDDTANKLFDVDYDKEFGGSTIFTSQDMIDEEFQDIAKLKVLEVSGDDRFGKKVIVFYACRLPNVASIKLDRLLMYLMKTMGQFVRNDYSLIYFHHGLTNKNNPGLQFMLKTYKQIDRDFKKNLKNLFIVHPTNMLKLIISTLLPFFSPKVSKKIIKIRRLKELESNFYLDQLAIPEVIKTYDNNLFSSSLNSADITGIYNNTIFYADEKTPTSQFGVSLQHIQQHYPNSAIPPVLEECIRYLSKTECIQCEGLFRRSPAKLLLEETQRKFDKGEFVDLESIGQPHLAASLIKTFLRSLSEPLMTFELFDTIVQIHNCTLEVAIENIRVMVSEMLPDYNYRVLKYVVEFLIEVANHSDKNFMNLQNLANVFAPNLIWSRNEASLTVIHIFIKFTHLLLSHQEKIFTRSLDF